ncbi:hypothetical protein V8E36_005396 [Tilletia maclaganii]
MMTRRTDGAAPPQAHAPPGAIAQLSEHTSASMRAHLTFPTLSSLALAMIQNALDAGSKRISLLIDFGSWTLECDDDGRGFLPSFFVGGASSSKQRLVDENRYGRKGLAMSMMAHLGRLQVQSVPETAQGTAYTLIQKGETTIFSGKDPSQASRAFCRGSKVRLSDLFAQLPVRRRALDSSSKQKVEIERLKNTITVASLREPHVAFTHSVQSAATGQMTAAKEVLRIRKATSLRSRLQDAYSHHAFPSERLVELSDGTLGTDRVTIRGLLSLDPAQTRSIQHIFLNKHLLEAGRSVVEALHDDLGHASVQAAPTASPGKAVIRQHLADGDADLHSAIASVMQQCLTFRQSADKTQVQGFAQSRSEPLTKSPTKSRAGHPCYVIDITVRLNWDGDPALVEQAAGRDRISLKATLQDAISACLHRHGLLLISERIHSPLPLDSSFPAAFKDVTPSGSQLKTSDSSRKRRITEQAAVFADLDLEGQASDSAFTRHVDSATGRAYLIDPRTGNSYGVEASRFGSVGPADPAFPGPSDSASNTVGSVTRRTALARTPTALDASTPRPEWLSKSVSSWKNPVLPLQEEPDIPSVDDRAPTKKAASARKRELAMPLPAVQAHSRFFEDDGFRRQQEANAAVSDDEVAFRLDQIEATLDKDSLVGARVLGQVDRKFILCTIALPSSTVRVLRPEKALVLIDQHAADERVRVEQLLHDFLRKGRAGEPQGHSLRQPFEVNLASGESEGVRSHEPLQILLRRIGFGLVFSNARRDDDDAEVGDTADLRLSITTVPSIIKDRLVAELSLVTALTRSFLLLATEGTGLAQLSSLFCISEAEIGNEAPADSASEWVALLRALPKLMLDLIYSRACRGAIMFNDILTQEQCERLVGELAATAFPFQCAHGRPSMLPLVLLPRAPDKADRLDWDSLLADDGDVQ